MSRARYSAFTKPEITHAFANLVPMDDDLAAAGGSRRDIDLIWGAVLTRYLTLVKFAGYGNVRSSGRVQTPTLAIIVEREREPHGVCARGLLADPWHGRRAECCRGRPL